MPARDSRSNMLIVNAPLSLQSPPSPATMPRTWYLLAPNALRLRSSTLDIYAMPVCDTLLTRGFVLTLTLLVSAEREPESVEITSDVPSTEKPKTEKPSRRGPAKTLCPPDLTACEMSGIALQDGRSPKSLACIDTQNDIEACGGCPFAGSDSDQGDDCTDMQGVDEMIVSKNWSRVPPRLLMWLPSFVSAIMESAKRCPACADSLCRVHRVLKPRIHPSGHEVTMPDRFREEVIRK